MLDSHDGQHALQPYPGEHHAWLFLLVGCVTILQDDKLYHATLYHASSHAAPVAAPAEKVAWEYAAIKGVTTATCPIRAVLDRIIVTASGRYHSAPTCIIVCRHVRLGQGASTAACILCLRLDPTVHFSGKADQLSCHAMTCSNKQ